MFTPRDIADLLDAARQSVSQDLLPTLSDDRRLAALMVANALSIASRYLTAGAAGTAPADIAEAADALLARCRAEVAITNPKALPASQ